MPHAHSIGQSHRHAIYTVPDGDVATGSTLGCPTVTAVIKATGALDRVFSIEAGASMFGSVLLYVPCLFLFSALWGNHGIWAAMLVLMAARSILLSLAWPRLKNSIGRRGEAN